MNFTMKKTLQSLGLVAALTLFGTAAYAGVVKKPYMIYEGDNTTMTVLWQDNASEATNTISWGTDNSYGMGSGTVPEYGTSFQHKYKITGLQPSTKYFYQVADAANGVYGTGSFITAPDANASAVKFLAFGDTRSGPLAMEGVAQEMRRVYATDPAFQSLNLQAGDWVSSDAESSWTSQWFNTNPQTQLLLAEQPVNGVKGNHENASGYSVYFPKYYPFPYPQIALKAGTTNTYNNLYWSFDYGPIHFTVVDQYSGYTAGTAQYNWVENDLKTTTKPWKILVYHEPAWTAGTHGNNTTTQATFDPLIKKYNVDLVYSGHNHNYARCQVDNYAQSGTDSIIPQVPYITNGGGGAGLYAVDTTNTGTYKHVVKAVSQYEYSTFEVNDKTLTMKVYLVTKADGTNLSSLVINPDTKSTLYETVVVNHPTANAGGGRTIGSNQEQCGVIVNGAASIANNVPLQYRWLEGGIEVLPWTAVGGNGEANLDLCKVSGTLGQHALQLVVTDGQHKASGETVLTILDTTPPTLTAKANRTVLWPPHHNMVNISIDTATDDNSGVKPTLSAVVTSNEPENGLGDGDTAPDMTTPVIDQKSGKISLQLRVERSGAGTGRVYAVAVTATDAAGNTNTVPVKISVPHDMD